MIRVKEGLLKLGTAYCDLAHKCLVIFTAHQNIAAQLPDVTDRDIQGVKYTGAGAATRCVQEAKERVRSFRRSSTSPPKAPAPHPSDPPSPYTPTSTTHFFPATAPAPPHPPLTHSPSLPEEHTPNTHTPSSAHSTSTPNLTEGTHTHTHTHAHAHAHADTSTPPPLTFDPDTQTYRHTDSHLRNHSNSCQFTTPPYNDPLTPPPQQTPQQPPSRPPPHSLRQAAGGLEPFL
ncbi:proline-rich receptor-like protein kinase PERK2 [Portunus trituberculatus]|uniref:proline-rich receptor-like protein kinase PERK2 n=1 Tax=Portunus trituberculatus TaxID=210409 RepID=UPI001E1D1BDF|nr:proline-rich receptor-like protein kinase PERK2 [Portunus trituberculatus]